MANQRYMTVRQRAARAVEKRLASIKQENGYSTNVLKVTRSRKLPLTATNPPEIIIMFKKGENSYRGTHHNYYTCPMDIWFIMRRVDKHDDEYSIFAGDIQKALNPFNPIYDDTYPGYNKPEVYVEEIGEEPVYNDVGDQYVYGKLEFQMEFFYHAGDPRLWDGECDELVPYPEEV